MCYSFTMSNIVIVVPVVFDANGIVDDVYYLFHTHLLLLHLWQWLLLILRSRCSSSRSRYRCCCSSSATNTLPVIVVDVIVLLYLQIYLLLLMNRVLLLLLILPSRSNPPQPLFELLLILLMLLLLWLMTMMQWRWWCDVDEYDFAPTPAVPLFVRFWNHFLTYHLIRLTYLILLSWPPLKISLPKLFMEFFLSIFQILWWQYIWWCQRKRKSDYKNWYCDDNYWNHHTKKDRSWFLFV